MSQRGKKNPAASRCVSLPGERFTRRALAALQSEVRCSSFAVRSPTRCRFMNRAIALLSVSSLFLISAAARAADDGDAKKQPTSDNAALFDKLDANHDGFITSDEVPQESRRLFDRLIRRGDKNSD